MVLEELNQRMGKAQSKLPCNCTYNHQQPIDLRKKIRNQPNPNYNTIAESNAKVGLCMYGAEDIQNWPGNICDEPSDAKGCPMYTSIHTKESVLRALHQDLEDRDWLRVHMPTLEILLWALEEETPQLPWWRRLLLKLGWFRRHRVLKVSRLLGA